MAGVAKTSVDVQRNASSGNSASPGHTQDSKNPVVSLGYEAFSWMFTQEQYKSVWTQTQAFVVANPKLSKSLGIDAVLTGFVPGLFVLISLAVVVLSLGVGLVVGLLMAALITILFAGLFLIITLPATYSMTLAAFSTLVFFLGGFVLFRWLKHTAIAQLQMNYNFVFSRFKEITTELLNDFMTEFLNDLIASSMTKESKEKKVSPSNQRAEPSTSDSNATSNATSTDATSKTSSERAAAKASSKPAALDMCNKPAAPDVRSIQPAPNANTRVNSKDVGQYFGADESSQASTASQGTRGLQFHEIRSSTNGVYGVIPPKGDLNGCFVRRRSRR